MKIKRLQLIDYMVLILFIAIIILSTLKIARKSFFISVRANESEYRFPLDEDGIYDIEGAIGTTTIEIKNEKIRFLFSPCPNKTCISEEFTNTVVCLPNKVIATVYGEKEEFDAIAQ